MRSEPHFPEEIMSTTRTYVSAILPYAADIVWRKIDDFGEYRWGEGVGAAQLSGDTNVPGAIRTFQYYDQTSRQRLIAYTSEKRSMQWESVEAFDATLSYYAATIRVTPVTVTDESFVEWWSDFEADDASVERWDCMQREEFRKSIERLGLCIAWDLRAS
jgi:hypothetical protein